MCNVARADYLGGKAYLAGWVVFYRVSYQNFAPMLQTITTRTTRTTNFHKHLNSCNHAKEK